MAETTIAALNTGKTIHLSQSIMIHATPEKVFAYMDDIHNTGWHMEKTSMPLMGGKMSVEILSKQRSGLGSTFRWTGRVLGLTIDFTETVVRWVANEERVWRTVGDPRILIIGNYEMRFFTKQVLQGTQLTVEIDYELPKPLFWNFMGRLLASSYSRWCLTNMCNDARAALEHDASPTIPQID